MVCAVIVTFNRKELLIRTIQSVLDQTHKVDAIFIIDNGSTDGTLELLHAEGFLGGAEQEQPEGAVAYLPVVCGDVSIRLWHSKKNLGGAGGFSLGQSLAFSQGHEWIWMMDDDGRPDNSCLERLFSAIDTTGLNVLNPLVVDEQDETRLSFGLPGEIYSVNDANNCKDLIGDRCIFGVANPFNGTLIHRRVLDLVGFVKKEMFIWGDESEFMLRLSKNSVAYATVTDAIFRHPKSKTSLQKVLGLFYLETKPRKLEMNFIRNKGYIDKVYNKRFSCKLLVKYFIYYLASGDFRRFFMAVRYYVDGWKGQFYLPNILD